MSDVETLEDYKARFLENHFADRQDGVVTEHFPCPFCAARDWYTIAAEEFARHEMNPHYCVECDRSARFIFYDDDGRELTDPWHTWYRSGERTFRSELVQCSGPNAPDWMVDIPRREDEQERAVSEGRMEMPAKPVAQLRTKRKQLTVPTKGKLKPPSSSSRPREEERDQ